MQLLIKRVFKTNGIKAILVNIFTLSFGWGQSTSDAWVNEIHYDNNGSDTGEGVEIVIRDIATYPLENWSVELYNGSNSTKYGTINFTTPTSQESRNGFTIAWKTKNGIQNGAPDGLALVYNSSTLVQFLSYEGQITATDGTANGETSTNIGVNESGSTPSGHSLQLSGSGSIYSDFSWQSAGANTAGSINTSQTILAVTITGDAGWRMLSLPITGGTVEDIFDDTPVQGIAGGDDASEDANFYYNDGSDEDGTSDGWDEPTNVSTAWGDGLGFILFFFDNTNNGSSVLPVTLDVSGSEPGSDVTVTLSDTYTLVGNPFASNINLDDITGNDSEEGTQDGLKSPISVWSDADGSYTTYNLGASKIVSAWQGFFLERNSNSTSELTIPTSAKTSSAATISIFSKMMMTNRRTLELRLDAPNGTTDIANKLYFTDISHENEDAFDGGKLLPLDGSPSLAFIQEFDGEERLLVQDARTYQPEEDQTYKLAILDAGVGGTYQISWPVMDNIPSDWEITLTDLETDAVVNMQEEEFYTFYIQNPIGQLQTDPLQPVTVDANAVYRNTVPPRFSITISGFALGFDNNSLPNNFALYPAYPNPFNPSTTIRFDVPEEGFITMNVYNITGKLVETLVNEVFPAGSHSMQWNPVNLSSGVYIVQLKAGETVFNQKITYIK